MSQNVLRQNKIAIYRLKRNYGLSCRIYRPEPDSYAYDLETGRQQRVWDHIDVKRGIRLPAVIATKFVYDLSFIAANKNFTYGGFFNADTVLFIFDRKDLIISGTTIFTVDSNSHIEVEGKLRYQVSKSIEVEELAAYMISTTAVTGDLPVTEQEPSPS